MGNSIFRHLGRAGLASAAIILAVTAGTSGAAYADDTAGTTVTDQNQDPGWYVGFDALYSRALHTDGTATLATSSTTGTSGSGCLLPINLIGNVTLGVLGCILGPGTGGTSGTTGSSSTGPSKLTYKPGAGVGFNLGYMLNGGLRPELSFDYVNNDIKTFSIGGTRLPLANATLDAYRLMGNLWYDIDFGIPVVPYLGGGVGVQRTELSNDGSNVNKNSFAFQLGAGLNFWITDRLAISADYRYIDSQKVNYALDSNGSTLDTQYKAHQAGIGAKFLFGAGRHPNVAKPVTPPPQVVPVVAAPPPPALKCTNVPDNIPKQFIGPDGCPLDSDGDGVPDYMDECPHTPAGAKVLPNGCALRGDCRNPRPGEQVDEHGCAIEHNFILKGVKFEFDSDRLTPAAKEILNQVSETLKSYPEVNVEVQGHTDYIGTDAYNLGLSEKRAIAVKNYLTGNGVDGKRLTPVGYGKTRPVDTNETEAGRENNRRVELKVLD
jgi:OOP family OmpA-OmpF porin